MKYHEFIGCGGWDGEIEKQEQDGAILIVRHELTVCGPLYAQRDSTVSLILTRSLLAGRRGPQSWG